MKHLLNDHKDCLHQHKYSHKLCDEIENPGFEFEDKPMETDTITWSKFPYGWKAIVE